MWGGPLECGSLGWKRGGGPSYRFGLLELLEGIGGLLQLHGELLGLLLDRSQLALHQVVLLRLLRASHLSLLDASRRPRQRGAGSARIGGGA